MAEQMPKVDMAKEFANLNESDKHFVRKLENLNSQRASDLKTMKTRNKYMGLVTGGFVLGVYFYTLYSMRQEKFLDDFEEPNKKD